MCSGIKWYGMGMNELNLLSECQLMSFIHLWKWTLFCIILQFLPCLGGLDFIEFSGRASGKTIGNADAVFWYFWYGCLFCKWTVFCVLSMS